MTTEAILFMIGSWAFVISLTGWSYWRILRGERSRPGEHRG